MRETPRPNTTAFTNNKMFLVLKTWPLLLFLLHTTQHGVVGERSDDHGEMEGLDEPETEVAWRYIPLSGPSIDQKHSKNVTAQLGKMAVLNCRVKYLGGKAVSWIRARDLHLLTVSRFTYTSDERFKAAHQPGSDDWLLKIHYVQHRDAGIYECQVSTTPPITQVISLRVVEPETRVLGGPDLYINSGSTINLTCVVSFSPEPPPYIFWYHESKLLSYDSPRGGITVVTEHGKTSTSRLLIQRASVDDAGRYTCGPANSDPHSIAVHIIHNENKAAISHVNKTSGGCQAAVHHLPWRLQYWTDWTSYIMLVFCHCIVHLINTGIITSHYLISHNSYSIRNTHVNLVNINTLELDRFQGRCKKMSIL